eukprot:366466-Chlamydomonas_euryale.AAC.16
MTSHSSCQLSKTLAHVPTLAAVGYWRRCAHRNAHINIHCKLPGALVCPSCALVCPRLPSCALVCPRVPSSALVCPRVPSCAPRVPSCALVCPRRGAGFGRVGVKITAMTSATGGRRLAIEGNQDCLLLGSGEPECVSWPG